MDKLLAKMEQHGLDLTGKLRRGLRRKACGGYADVYIGFLEDGTEVAVKHARFVRDDLLIRRAVCKVSSCQRLCFFFPF